MKPLHSGLVLVYCRLPRGGMALVTDAAWLARIRYYPASSRQQCRDDAG